jgi:hypothetical protein
MLQLTGLESVDMDMNHRGHMLGVDPGQDKHQQLCSSATTGWAPSCGKHCAMFQTSTDFATLLCRSALFHCFQVGVLGDEITNASNVVAKGRLGPGQMVLADIVDGKFAGELVGLQCLSWPNIKEAVWSALQLHVGWALLVFTPAAVRCRLLMQQPASTA